MMESKGVLLTGATGFVGRHVLQRLRAEGFVTLALRRSSSPRQPDEEAGGLVRWLEADERLPRDFLEEHGVAAVIHAATAYTWAGVSLGGIANANLLLPLRIVDQLLECGMECDFINCGTCIPAHTNAYALSKRQFVEWLTLVAANQTRWRAVNLVLYYVYGGDEVGPNFSASLIAACRARAAEFLMTQGTQVRDFIHVTEAAAAVVEVLKQRSRIPYGFTSLDVGTGTGTSLRAFAEAAVRISGAPTRLRVGSLPPRTAEPPELVADTGPLDRLGWRSGVDVESGLKSVFERSE